jgi:hypothetical protein
MMSMKLGLGVVLLQLVLRSAYGQKCLFDGDNGIVPAADSNIAVAMRSGILLTEVSFSPAVVTGTEQPFIDVSSAIAPKPFLDYLNWADPDGFCGSLYAEDPRSGGCTGASAEENYSDVGVPFASPLFPSFANIVKSFYYVDVLPKLNEMGGTTGNGCVKPKHAENLLLKWNSMFSPIHSLTETKSCYTFSPDFISNFDTLPMGNPDKDWAKYIEFCEMYGYRVFPPPLDIP